MQKNYRLIIILLIFPQIFFPQISSAADAVSQDFFSFDEENNDVIDSFYYNYQKGSMWMGFYNLEAWFYSNQTVSIKYSLNFSGSININEGEGSDYFPFLNEFEMKVQDGNWDYHANLIKNINNWKYENSTENPGICDGGTFTEIIKIYKSGSVVNSSIYIIDNNSCTGKRSIPQDSNVIDLMGKIQNYIVELVKSNQLTSSEAEKSTVAFQGTYFIIIVLIISIIKIKRRKLKL